jgi:Mce-associated membrane protein
MAGRRNAIRAVSALRGKAWRFGVAHRGVLLTAWTVVVLALAGAAGALWWQHRQHETTNAAGLAALDAARQATVEVLSYNFRTVDADLARARGHLTGRFREDFARRASGIVAPAAIRDQIDTRAEVAGSGLVSATPEQAVALVFVNQTTRSVRLPAPKIDGSRLEMTLRWVDGRWLISDLKPL